MVRNPEIYRKGLPGQRTNLGNDIANLVRCQRIGPERAAAAGVGNGCGQLDRGESSSEGALNDRVGNIQPAQEFVVPSHCFFQSVGAVPTACQIELVDGQT